MEFSKLKEFPKHCMKIKKIKTEKFLRKCQNNFQVTSQKVFNGIPEGLANGISKEICNGLLENAGGMFNALERNFKTYC